MDSASDGKARQLPEEMFTIIRSAGQSLGPRLGRLALPGRKIIETPHYLGNTSRGVVPHITQDTFTRDTNISGVYVALEDFLDRAPKHIPPLYAFRPHDGTSPLRRFIALPDDTLVVVGARRTPPVVAPSANPNTNSTISVCTAVGFKLLKADDYTDGVEGLKADVVVSLGDIPYGRALGSKRTEKATDRMVQWLQDHVALRSTTEGGSPSAKASLFASLLPITCTNQQFYIDYLVDEVGSHISGLALFGLAPLEDLPEPLQHHPRLGFTEPSSPQQVLRHIAHGIDILTVPFISAATDAGIALDFRFSGSTETSAHEQSATTPRTLGIDMWSTEHAVDLSPLSRNCQCYACTNHHRAYVQHLLTAKEMLGWVLLQIHNHHVMDRFFDGIRSSIREGRFEADTAVFEKVYESQLPEKTGQGPRVRGYQFKSEGPSEPKKNPAPFIPLGAGEGGLTEGTLPNPETDAEDLQDSGFAKKEEQ